MRLLIPLLAILTFLIALTGCASTDEVDPRETIATPSTRSSTPTVRPGTPSRDPIRVQPRPSTIVAAPSPSTPPPAVKPSVSASPYFFVAPHIGKWQWIIDPARGLPDPNFTLLLNPRNEVEFGPYFRGSYRMLDDKTIELVLIGHGDYNGRRPGPMLFRIEYYDGGMTMVFRQGDNTSVFKRVP